MFNIMFGGAAFLPQPLALTHYTHAHSTRTTRRYQGGDRRKDGVTDLILFLIEHFLLPAF